MALASQTVQAARKNICKVGALISALDDDDARTLQDWIANPDVALAAIALALECEYGGRPASESALRRHRSERCVCE